MLDFKTIDADYLQTLLDQQPACTDPAPLCFSCGRSIPHRDYAIFHALKEEYSSEQKLMDDMEYLSECCRRMFVGDAIECRRILALYDMETLNLAPRF